MNIAVVGLGYVGMANSVLLAQYNKVFAVDISEKTVEMVNNGISPIEDKEITMFLEEKKLNLIATSSYEDVFSVCEIVIIATPTNYDPRTGNFDTSSIEDVIEKILRVNRTTLIIIKSTIPVGYTEKLRNKYNANNIVFSPEFLREGKALFDNLYPSRIIVGEKSSRAKKFADLLVKGSYKENVEVVLMDSTEAEAVKLFANTYLAMRVAYFNELDSYAEMHNLSTKDIIRGVSLDPRVGDHYNNPSFGYGGYCLPKDTKQLLSNFEGVPQSIISAIVESNDIRKQHIVDQILKKNPSTIGIYRLIMKSGSDNFRESAIQDVINRLSMVDVKIIIFEPQLDVKYLNNIEIVNNIDEFIHKSDIIVANRITEELQSAKNKLYTRDLFHRD